MSGLKHAFTRSPATRALLAGVALLGWATAGARAADVSDDVAFAQPRMFPRGRAIALPQPLARSDALRLQRAFEQQARADLPAVLREVAEVSNPLLFGHLLADRYLGACAITAVPTEDQLRQWLARYADLPDAPLIVAALPTAARSSLPPLPATRPVPAPAPPLDDVDGVVRLLSRNATLDRSVHEPARAGRAEQAVRLIARTRGLDPLYGALLRAEVAQILFTQGRDAEALALAETANHQARGQVGLAPFIAGLAAWRLNRTEHAQTMFEAAYAASLTSPGRRSAAAFWAARAALRGRDSVAYAPWMQRAAENPRTFYGLLARRALGQAILTPEPTATWTLGQADLDAVSATPAGMRAFALLQIGQTGRAEAELRRLWADTQDQTGYMRSILLVARTAGLNGLATQIADVLLPQDGLTMRLPAARLMPRGGFKVDPALVHAMARLESNFNPTAVSHAGARGLMQLMPGTAGFVLGRGAMTASLHDPATNLDVAQRYLLQMSEYDVVQSDLIRLLASYNSGPANLGRWSAELKHMGDPLLFIESVPNDETRAYIPRVLTYTWLYAAQLHLPSPSLDELAAGTWPRFRAYAGRGDVVARLH